MNELHFCNVTCIAICDNALCVVAGCRFPYGLLDIDMSNNSGITGIVPAEMG